MGSCHTLIWVLSLALILIAHSRAESDVRFEHAWVGGAPVTLCLQKSTTSGSTSGSKRTVSFVFESGIASKDSSHFLQAQYLKMFHTERSPGTMRSLMEAAATVSLLFRQPGLVTLVNR